MPCTKFEKPGISAQRYFSDKNFGEPDTRKKALDLNGKKVSLVDVYWLLLSRKLQTWLLSLLSGGKADALSQAEASSSIVTNIVRGGGEITSALKAVSSVVPGLTQTNASNLQSLFLVQFSEQFAVCERRK